MLLLQQIKLHPQKIIHISFSEEPAHIKQWYKQVYREVANAYKLENPIENFDQVIQNRLILHFRQTEIALDHVKEHVQQFVKQADFSPEMIIVDGFSFYDHDDRDFEFWKVLRDLPRVDLVAVGVIDPGAEIPFEPSFYISHPIFSPQRECWFYTRSGT